MNEDNLQGFLMQQDGTSFSEAVSCVLNERGKVYDDSVVVNQLRDCD